MAVKFPAFRLVLAAATIALAVAVTLYSMPLPF
jgi:hypothetical protein